MAGSPSFVIRRPMCASRAHAADGRTPLKRIPWRASAHTPLRALQRGRGPCSSEYEHPGSRQWGMQRCHGRQTTPAPSLHPTGIPAPTEDAASGAVVRVTCTGRARWAIQRGGTFTVVLARPDLDRPGRSVAILRALVRPDGADVQARRRLATPDGTPDSASRPTMAHRRLQRVQAAVRRTRRRFLAAQACGVNALLRLLDSMRRVIAPDEGAAAASNGFAGEQP